MWRQVLNLNIHFLKFFAFASSNGSDDTTQICIFIWVLIADTLLFKSHELA